MKKNNFFLAIIAVCFLAASCNRQAATISGCIENAGNAKITLVHEGASVRLLLDTLRADSKGCFSYKIKKKGKVFDPQFVSFSVNDTIMATLLVEQGQNIKINGKKGSAQYTVEGSEGSAQVQQLNLELQQSSHRFDSLMRLVQTAQAQRGSFEVPAQLSRALRDVVVAQYQSAMRFVQQHQSSLACITVFNQRMPNGLPVFSRNEDAIPMRTVYDSLVVRYPHSEYVLALRAEYEQRFHQLSLQGKMSEATQSGFIDLSLPNTKAEIVSLSSLAGKVVLLYFWISTDKAQLSYNNELKDLYNKYQSKGLAIYQVALDSDKVAWAKNVEAQQLPWVNVCDGYGVASPAVAAYNLNDLPKAFIINKDGDLVATNLSNKEIERKLKDILR